MVRAFGACIIAYQSSSGAMNGHLSVTSDYRTFLAICLLAVITPHVSAHKFLVYNPRFGKSHVLFMGKLADLLAEAGHEVVRKHEIPGQKRVAWSFRWSTSP